MEQVHQEAHLGARPLPVLIGEDEQGEVGDADLARGFDHRAYRVLAAAMALRTRKPMLARPSPVAVHHDRDVARQPLRLERETGKFVQWE